VRITLIIIIFLINTIAYAYADKSARIAAFKQSWTAKALRLQREIDVNTPLNEATILGTHNSYNSSAYQTPYRYPDPNHIISIYDQLEMGIRSVELDAHWSITNTFAHNILLCHSDADHHECGYYDRPFTQGLTEIRDWLTANPGEVVLLYIEKHVDGHEPRLASYLEQYLGKYIYKTNHDRNKNAEANSCVPLPGSMTKADVLRAGKQLLIVTKGCDGNSLLYVERDKYPLIWNDYVFAGVGMIPDRPFEFIDVVPDEFSAYPDCGKSGAFLPDINHTSLWRVYEDGTMGTSHVKRMDAAQMQEIVRCGINWQTMDQLKIADPRLRAAIWSWATDYPKDGHGTCASYQQDAGIVNTDCENNRSGYACQDIDTHSFTAIAASGNWNQGKTVCRQLGKSWRFATPINGQQMDELKQKVAALNLKDIWLNYFMDRKGNWVAK
jgi:hypothetical protein